MFTNQRKCPGVSGWLPKPDTALIYIAATKACGWKCSGQHRPPGGRFPGWTRSNHSRRARTATIDEKRIASLRTLGILRTHPADFAGAVNLCVKSGLNKVDSQFCLKGVVYDDEHLAPHLS